MNLAEIEARHKHLMKTLATQIDAGAEALRQHEHGGRLLRTWGSLPNVDKKKWRIKVQLVLRAMLDAK